LQRGTPPCLRIATAVVATLAFVGCCVYVVGTGNGLPQDLVKEAKAELTPAEHEKAELAGEHAEAPQIHTDSETEPTSIADGNDGDYEDAADDVVTMPAPQGKLQRNCMEAKEYFYVVQDEFDDLDNREGDLGGALVSLIEALAPATMDETTMTPAACEAQFDHWHTGCQNEPQDSVIAVQCAAIHAAFTNAGGVTHKITRHDAAHHGAQMITINGAAAGLTDAHALDGLHLDATMQSMVDIANEMHQKFTHDETKSSEQQESNDEQAAHKDTLTEAQEDAIKAWNGGVFVSV